MYCVLTRCHVGTSPKEYHFILATNRGSKFFCYPHLQRWRQRQGKVIEGAGIQTEPLFLTTGLQ